MVWTFKKLWLPTLLILYVLLALSSAVGEHGFVHLWKLRQEQQIFESEAVALLQENNDLRDRITRLKTDNGYLEKVVREELKFTKKGEIVYLFRAPSEPPEQ
jgi:cell division protein FtsB